MEFQPRLYTIFYRSWARKIEEFRNRYFVSSHPCRALCARGIRFSPFEGPRTEATASARGSQDTLPDPCVTKRPGESNSNSDRVAPRQSFAGFIRTRLPEAPHGSSHREETRTRKIAPRCNVTSAQIGETFARVLVMLYKFWNSTHVHTHAYVHINRTHTFCAIRKSL